ncbi:hypothetical protein Gorai_021034, partial [Gossypium raimondii]|nr:hypothetical protein [Gossypium raimondii]
DINEVGKRGGDVDKEGQFTLVGVERRVKERLEGRGLWLGFLGFRVHPLIRNDLIEDLIEWSKMDGSFHGEPFRQYKAKGCSRVSLVGFHVATCPVE